MKKPDYCTRTTEIGGIVLTAACQNYPPPPERVEELAAKVARGERLFEPGRQPRLIPHGRFHRYEF